MSAERWPLIPLPSEDESTLRATFKKGEEYNIHINAICNDIRCSME